MIKTSKNKILLDVVKISNLVVRKINKHEFWYILQKYVKKSKMAITFAYDVEKKRIIYQTEEDEKLIPNSIASGRFGNF